MKQKHNLNIFGNNFLISWFDYSNEAELCLRHGTLATFYSFPHFSEQKSKIGQKMHELFPLFMVRKVARELAKNGVARNGVDAYINVLKEPCKVENNTTG